MRQNDSLVRGALTRDAQASSRYCWWIASMHVERARASGHSQALAAAARLGLAVIETVTLLHPPLPSAGASTVMERERQQNASLANGYPGPLRPSTRSDPRTYR